MKAGWCAWRKPVAAMFLAAGLGPLIGAEAPVRADQVSSPRSQSLLERNRSTWGVTPQMVGVGQGNAGSRSRSGLPQAAQAQIDAMRISREPMEKLVRETAAQRQAALRFTDPAKREEALRVMRKTARDFGREAATRAILRNLYSPDQMREQMTWFWFNHFNVYGGKMAIWPMIGDYEETIRGHALGKYRDLLEATLRHPAMLRYLDNEQNRAGRLNENYAREIMELHSMGVGSGYSQKDVQELARILTGVGVRGDPGRPNLSGSQQALYIRQGLFEFNPARHDFGTKQFLGHTIAGSGFDEVETALDLIANSPATSRYVSTRIATYFMGAAPPPDVVDRMIAAWNASDGDIPAVLAAMESAPAYKASLGQAFKDPMHYVMSAVRYAYGDTVIRNADPLLAWLKRMGQSPYERLTPDGYPLEGKSWAGSGQMAERLEIARALGSGATNLLTPRGESAGARIPPPDMRNALWKSDALKVSAQTRAVLDQAKTTREWNTLFLASPDFMQR